MFQVDVDDSFVDSVNNDDKIITIVFQVDVDGRMTTGFKTYAICGAIRRMGESDDCINRLAKKDGIIDKKF